MLHPMSKGDWEKIRHPKTLSTEGRIPSHAVPESPVDIEHSVQIFLDWPCQQLKTNHPAEALKIGHFHSGI